MNPFKLLWGWLAGFISAKKLEIYGVAIVVLVIFGAWEGSKLRGLWDEHNLASAIAATQKQCKDNDRITQEASNDYQNKIAALTAGYNAELRKLRAKGNPVHAPAAPVGPDAGPDPECLLSLAYDCEKQHTQLLSLQEFVRKTWAAHP